MKATAITTERKDNSVQVEKDKAAMKVMQSGSTVEAQNAFAQIYARYKSPITFEVLRMVKMNKELTNDLVQEIFTKVFVSKNQYDFSVAFSTWLYKIARNHVIDQQRKTPIEVFSIETLKSEFGGDEDGSNSEASFQIEDKNADTFNDVVRVERAALVRETLAQVKNVLAREIIEMIYLEGMAYDKVAEAKGLPVGTVKAIMFRTKTEMFNLISKTDLAKTYGRVYNTTKKWKDKNGKVLSGSEVEEIEF